MRRSGGRWLLAFPLAMALGLVTLPLAKGSVDGALADRARAALAGAGVGGVEVSSDWAGLRLSGPADRREAAVAAVAAMADADAVARVEYVSAAGDAVAVSPPSTSTGTPTQSPSGTPSLVAPSVVVSVLVHASGAGAKRVVVLSGTVAGPRQHDALVAAVRSAAPKARIRDTLLTVTGAPPDAVRAAFPSFVRVAGQVCGAFGIGAVRVDERGLRVDGITTTEKAAGSVARTLAAAKSAGVPVRSTVRGPVLVARKRLAAVKGLRGIAFTSSSDRLTQASTKTLTTAAAVLRVTPGVVVRINGYTDNAGAASFNRALSTRRAAAVKAFLVSRGVPAARLAATGFGEARPVKSNKTPAGRAANRRIEFVVQGS